MDGWFPRLNSRGDVVSGSKTLWVNKQQLPVTGLEPKWLDDHTVFYKGVDDLPYKFDLTSRKGEKLGDTKGVVFDAGAGKWAISTTPLPVSIDPTTGRIARLVEHNPQTGNDNSITVDGVVRVSHRSVHRPVLRDGLLAYVEGTTKVWVDTTDATVFKGWHGIVIPVKGPNGAPWVLVQTNEDLRLYPVGSKFGYPIPTGEDNNFHPDVRFIAGSFHIVWNTEDGKPGREVIPPSRTRVDVSMPFKHVPLPPPQKNPDPPKEPVVERKRKDLPADIHAIVVALHAKYIDWAKSKDDSDRRKLARAIAETVRARKGERYGLKSAHSNLSSPGKDSLAEIPEGEKFAGHGKKQFLFIWDLFNGDTREPHRHPIPSVKVEESEQYFIPVEANDHLGWEPEPVPEPTPEPKPEPVPNDRVVALLEAIFDSQLKILSRQEAIEVDLLEIKEEVFTDPGCDCDFDREYEGKITNRFLGDTTVLLKPKK